MTAADPLVRVATGRGLATLTLDSPGNRNALSRRLMTELQAGLRAAAADDDVRVVVLSHTGPVFCSGADLKETAAAYAAAQTPSDAAAQTPSDAAAQTPSDAAEPDRTAPDGTEPGGAGPGGAGPGGVPAALLGDLLVEIWECPKPVVARVGGPARAGGLGLIAAADLAVCAEDATFAFSEVRIGVVPAIISATVLRRLSPRAAAELLLTGEVFDGRRAAAVGLVTAAAPAAALDETVAAYCDALVRGGPTALAATKRLLARARAATVREDMVELSSLSMAHFGSAEGIEGVLAFREKRAPRWLPRG